jgi:hypothetical protein
MAALLFSLACVTLAFGLGGVYLGKEAGVTTLGNLAAAAASIRRRQVGLARKVWGRALVNTLVAVVVTAGILVAASRLNFEWDFTKPRVYTLSDFSLRVLEDLPVDVEAVYVGGPKAPEQERLLLEAFARASKHFSLRIVSPQELSPEAARQIERGGSKLFIHAGGRPMRVPAPTERYIIQTVLALSTRQSTTLCFTTGHGEFALQGDGPRGLSVFRAMLEREGFQTSDLLLAAREAVPEECEIVVVAAPERPFLPAERERLKAFADRGGRLLVFTEPDRPLEPGPLLEEHGLSDIPAIVVDEDTSVLGSPIKGAEPIVNRFTDFHPVVDGLNERTGVVFSGAEPLVLRGGETHGFAYSSRTSRIESLGGGSVAERQEIVENLPPWMQRTTGGFPLGATIEWNTENGKEARIVVFGDMDLATNRLIGVLYNEDLVMNAVYYLASREDEINIRPKVEELYQAPLIPEATLSAYHSLALAIPEAILVLGLVIWFRRRRL